VIGTTVTSGRLSTLRICAVGLALRLDNELEVILKERPRALSDGAVALDAGLLLQDASDVGPGLLATTVQATGHLDPGPLAEVGHAATELRQDIIGSDVDAHGPPPAAQPTAKTDWRNSVIAAECCYLRWLTTNSEGEQREHTVSRSGCQGDLAIGRLAIEHRGRTCFQPRGTGPAFLALAMVA